MPKSTNILRGTYMDMMDSMQSVVFPDESDDDFGDSSEKKPLVELSSIAPILGEDAPLLHEKDTLPDTPTKDNLLSRLEGLEGPSYHHKKIESDENLESDENEGLVTQASRLKKSRTTSGVDLLHLDAPILHVMDRIEDEVEAHAYEDLVPLEIKLALEDKVFGWTHATSSLFGHIAFTCGSYSLVYEICTFVLKEFYGFRGATVIPAYWNFIRTSLALWAAFQTYRMVRRRRHVWFRAPYGSKAYKEDEQRRMKEVQETDQSTSMGKMMQSFRHRRVLKRLRKAETMFAKKHNAMVSATQRQVSFNMTETVSSSDDDSSDGEDTNSRTSSTTHASATLPSSSDHKMRRRPSFHTKPTNRMQSFAHDQTLFPTIDKVAYGHGGYFGAAPFLLSNPHWISILRHLMPDVYVEISRRVVHAPASRLIHWAENNPVVAAYAAAHELEYHDSKNISGIPNMEWDVFLDPLLVNRVHIVLEERDKFLATTSAPNTKKNRQILNFYNKELEQRSKTLVDKMLIAHGNVSQILIEQTGFAKYFNYSRVKRTRRTLGGGIYARQWMAVFAEALKLGVGYSDNENHKCPRKEASLRETGSLFALAESKCPESTLADSVRVLEKISNSKNPIGLVLDMKSRHVPKRVWSVVVDTLRNAGIRVEGIASFFVEEIRNLSVHCELPVQEIIFCHSAGDMQKACSEGKIHEGDSVFFNAGSLLWGASPEVNLIRNFDPDIVKQNYVIQPFGKISEKDTKEDEYSTIRMYKEQFNLNIGIYCQEFAIDEAAVSVLSKLANDNPDIYNLGFAWGGINGITIKGIAPGRFTATDGFWNQRYVGEMWNYLEYPVAKQ